jgi:hypothetical protein
LALIVGLFAVCQDYAARTGYLVTVTDGEQPVPQLAAGSR